MNTSSETLEENNKVASEVAGLDSNSSEFISTGHALSYPGSPWHYLGDSGVYVFNSKKDKVIDYINIGNVMTDFILPKKLIVSGVNKAFIHIDADIGFDGCIRERLFYLHSINVKYIVFNIFCVSFDTHYVDKFLTLKEKIDEFLSFHYISHFCSRFLSFSGDNVFLCSDNGFVNKGVLSENEVFNYQSFYKFENYNVNFFRPDEQTVCADQFSVTLFCPEKDIYSGRKYSAEMSGELFEFSFTKVDVLGYKEKNGFFRCNIFSDKLLSFDKASFSFCKYAFLIDPVSKERSGFLVFNFPLSRANNLRIEKLDVNKSDYSRHKCQKPVVIWFTGLSGSGKSTIANAVEKKLYGMGRHTYILDGDNVRHGLNRDLGFTDKDRVENIRRIGEVSKLMVDAGLITIVSFISPFQSDRDQARSIMEDNEFIEVFVKTPLSICQQRDVKGLYAKANRGEIKNFTGISSPYEEPQNPEIVLETAVCKVDELSNQVIDYLRQNNYFDL